MVSPPQLYVHVNNNVNEKVFILHESILNTLSNFILHETLTTDDKLTHIQKDSSLLSIIKMAFK